MAGMQTHLLEEVEDAEAGEIDDFLIMLHAVEQVNGLEDCVDVGVVWHGAGEQCVMNFDQRTNDC